MNKCHNIKRNTKTNDLFFSFHLLLCVSLFLTFLFGISFDFCENEPTIAQHTQHIHIASVCHQVSQEMNSSLQLRFAYFILFLYFFIPFLFFYPCCFIRYCSCLICCLNNFLLLEIPSCCLKFGILSLEAFVIVVR